jgi:hypothetical protein
MRDDWLIDVLCDIEDYALQHQLTWLVPLIERAHIAAMRELTPSAPIAFGKHRSLKRRRSADKELLQTGPCPSEILDFQLLKTQRSTRQS